MDIDIGSEDLTCTVDEARIVRDLSEDLIGAMDVEYRPDLVGLGFDDGTLIGLHLRVARKPLKLVGEECELFACDELIDRQIARVLEVLEISRLEGAVFGRAEDDRTPARENLCGLTGASRIEICGCGRS